MQDLFETNANESCSIGKTRNLFTSADICYADGQFMVALTNCNSNKSIIVKCFRVKIEHRLEKTILSSQAL